MSKPVTDATMIATLLGTLGNYRADLMMFDGQHGGRPFTVLVATGAAMAGLDETLKLLPGWEGELTERVRV